MVGFPTLLRNSSESRFWDGGLGRREINGRPASERASNPGRGMDRIGSKWVVFQHSEKPISRWGSIGVPTVLITNDFARNTGKHADRHLLASHLPRPTEMPSFRGSHSPDTCVPRNQWSVRCFRNGYRHTQDHYHRIWGNRRSFDGHGTFVVLRTTDSELFSNGR